mmetsp:Transcript_23243/g.68725  ORF Transcript_23243/g.68725 Transcript_23243/m.68725 type:complete len:214 (-) Transcript_23243:2003-2644(-)
MLGEEVDDRPHAQFLGGEPGDFGQLRPRVRRGRLVEDIPRSILGRDHGGEVVVPGQLSKGGVELIQIQGDAPLDINDGRADPGRLDLLGQGRQYCAVILVGCIHLPALHLDLKALAVPGLETLGGSEAAEFTPGHDPDEGAEGLALLHGMGGEDDGGAVLGELARGADDHVADDAPEVTACDGVHASAGLVQEHNLGLPDRGARHAQLPLHPP